MSCSSAARSFLLAPFSFFPLRQTGAWAAAPVRRCIYGRPPASPGRTGVIAFRPGTCVCRISIGPANQRESRGKARSSADELLSGTPFFPKQRARYFAFLLLQFGRVSRTSACIIPPFFFSLPRLALEMATTAILEVALARSSLRPRRRSSKSTTWAWGTGAPKVHKSSNFFFLKKKREGGECAS